MAECKDCFHHITCDGDVGFGYFKCPHFKNAADVVEVVRCKDCKYCEHCYPVKEIGGEAVEGWYCKIRKRCMRPDDFCSYGKRKEDE